MFVVVNESVVVNGHVVEGGFCFKGALHKDIYTNLTAYCVVMTY